MTDPRETASDRARLDDAPGGTAAPPPDPWWARTGSTGSERRTQPEYGSYAQQTTAPPPPEDPWRSPGSTAVFGTGAPAWGYPTDTIGRPPAPER